MRPRDLFRDSVLERFDSRSSSQKGNKNTTIQIIMKSITMTRVHKLLPRSIAKQFAGSVVRCRTDVEHMLGIWRAIHSRDFPKHLVSSDAVNSTKPEITILKR